VLRVPAKVSSGRRWRLAIPATRPHARTLANGLRVYALPNPDTASVSVAVWYDVGSKNDPAGRSGFAHLFEHLMFNPPPTCPLNPRPAHEDVGGMNTPPPAIVTNIRDGAGKSPGKGAVAKPNAWARLVVDDPASGRSARGGRRIPPAHPGAAYGRLFGLYLSQVNFDVHPYGRPGTAHRRSDLRRSKM